MRTKSKLDLIECTSCKTDKIDKEFIAYNSELNNSGHLPICRRCLKERFKKLNNLYNDVYMALFHLCLNLDFTFDYYYAKEIMDERVAAECVVKYFVDISSKGNPYPNGTTADNFMLENLKSLNAESGTRMMDLNPDRYNFTITEEMKHRWGSKRNLEDIYFLENTYNDLVESYGASLPTERNLYRDYALGELNLRKAEESGDTDLYMKLRKSQSVLMGDAMLKPSKDNTLSKDEQLIGVIARLIEDERPVAEAHESWKDVDGIGKIINEEYKNQLVKSVGIFK